MEDEFPHLRQANVYLLERLGKTNAERRKTIRDLKARHAGFSGQTKDRTDVLVDHWRRNDGPADARALQTSEFRSASRYSFESSSNT